ncbi:hypothetical protein METBISCDRAFT_21780 [Metschnikowia bicuspidata]|uniref:Snf7-domain-containing protein n=1 Tax=Metschnikowia bicuspidata TaxID=27322 RepID=A0A4P9ZG55_9ASCO|nr:hypothetical protein METBISCDRAFT_21780 [Metschnikowia bicuspidata]
MGPFKEVPQFKESRLASLYSDFAHLKEINPEGYRANLDAWLAVFQAALRCHTFHSSIVLPGAELPRAFRNTTHGVPRLLALSLDEHIRAGALVPWSIYKHHAVKSVRRAWDYLSPRKVADDVLGTYRVLLYRSDASMAVDAYIDWSLLVSVGDALYAQLRRALEDDPRLSALLFDELLFGDRLRAFHPALFDTDVLVLLVYYSRDTGRIGTATDPADSTKTYLRFGDATPLSDAEIAAARVKSAAHRVQKRIELLDMRFVELGDTARLLARAGASKHRLRNILVRKSALKKSLATASATHTQLIQILEKIDEAKSNVDLLGTLISAKSGLALLNEQISLADVDDVTAALDQEMALTGEISDVLMVSSGIDDDEIETELRALERETAKTLERKTESQAVSESGEPESAKCEEESAKPKESAPATESAEKDLHHKKYESAKVPVNTVSESKISPQINSQSEDEELLHDLIEKLKNVTIDSTQPLLKPNPHNSEPELKNQSLLA